MGVDTAGKETSSMWEIYAVSPPHGSNFEMLGARVCECLQNPRGRIRAPMCMYTIQELYKLQLK